MKTIYILTIIILFISLSSCKKDYYPEIAIDSINTSEGITSIKYSIIENDGGELSILGICYDSISDPYLATNQTLVNTNLRTINISNLEPEKTLYFKVFAGNDYGYAESKSVMHTIPYEIAPTPPCSVNENIISRNGSSYNTSIYSGTSTLSSNEFQVKIVCSSAFEIIIVFPEEPNNGVYEIVNAFNGYENDNVAKVTFRHSILGGIGTVAASGNNLGEKLYIENSDTEDFKVSFCNLNYAYENINYSLEGNYSK